MASLMRNVVHWSQNRIKSPPIQPQAVVDLCEICGKKPKFIDNSGHKHPFCSRSCARSGTGSSPTACILHGCRATGKPAFANYCSEAHAKEGVRVGQVEGCELCEVQPRIVGTMCIPCDRLIRAGPRLRELSPDSQVFKNVRAQFLSEWDSSGDAPLLDKVYEIILSRDARTRHDLYRTANPSNEEIRSFHSSQCICDLGTKDPVLCSFKSCGICSIVKSCFKAFAFGVSYNNGRFGDGIYSYRNPALADQHATSCTSSAYRVMIACDVCVDPGQTDEFEFDSDDLQSTADRSLFVPIADAILPAYVLMYCQ